VVVEVNEPVVKLAPVNRGVRPVAVEYHLNTGLVTLPAVAVRITEYPEQMLVPEEVIIEEVDSGVTVTVTL